MKKILLYMMIMAVLVSLCGCSLSNLQNVEMPEFMPSESAAPDPENYNGSS